MNKLLLLLSMLVMLNCTSPTINGGPKSISCSDAVMVLSVPPPTLPAWRSANSNITYRIEGGRIYVTMSSIPPAYLSAWLFDNNPYILFDPSTGAILCNHKIPNIGRFDLGKIKATLTFQEIKKIVADQKYTLHDTFRQYIGISFNDRNELKLNASTYFEPNKQYYSMAFFMAVGRNDGMSDSTRFTFHEGMYREVPVIIIEVNGRFQNYYDFAQYPPLR